MKTFRYAFSESNQIFDIDEVTDVIRQNHSFRCIGCGREMIARLGERNDHCFAHKQKVDCNGETYLHNLTKNALKAKFDDESKSFPIELYRDIECSEYGTCCFAKPYCGKARQPFHFNLKAPNTYNKCDVEKDIYVERDEDGNVKVFFEKGENRTHFIADLLLYNSDHPNRPPVLIEIWNTHKNDEKKETSGLKIIEIRIFNENNVKALMNSPIKENTYVERVKKEEKDYTATFTEFNPPLKSKKTLGLVYISRFILYQSGKIFVLSINCDKRHKKTKKNSIAELNIESFFIDPRSIGQSFLKRKGITIKDCCSCKYYHSTNSILYSVDYCALHKKFNTPEFPMTDEALTCQYFREDAHKVKIPQDYEEKSIVEEVKERREINDIFQNELGMGDL